MEPRGPSSQARRVGSVERAVAILEALAGEREELGTNELARAVGVNASTVSRILSTLLDAGFVERAPVTGRYRLGMRVLQLGAHVLTRLDAGRLTRPALERLAEATGETTTVSLPAEGEAITVDFVPSRSAVRSVTPIGRPSIAHATAVGKIMLAYAPGALDRLPVRLQAFTEATITDPADLAAAVAEVRRRGWAVALGEREPDLHAVAAPVLDHRGALHAILGLQGPAGRLAGERLDAARTAVVEEAATLSRSLGGAGTRPPGDPEVRGSGPPAR